jgi:antitoxin component YwqK of YwqJK toxin-antitoxin module
MFWNLPALPKSLRPLLFALLLFLGGAAGTQEPDTLETMEALEEAGEMAGDPAFAELPPQEPLPEARWFRSNAAGMTLEELPSRLAALRNEYALVMDFIPPAELPPVLAPRYEEPWRVEVHVLYKEGGESRRRWIFREPGGAARLVAVFDQDLLNPPEKETPEGEAPPGGEAGAVEAEAGGEAAAGAVPGDEAAGDEAGAVEAVPGGEAVAGVAAGDEAATVRAVPGGEAVAEAETGGETSAAPALTGFIETYNQDGRIREEHLFHEDGEESITRFMYRNGRLIRAELLRKTRTEEGEQASAVYTDFYRYSRSASLRAVERVYHAGAEQDSPVLLRFPRMILDAAADKDFISPNVFYGTAFPGDSFVGESYRILYTTDERGRILSETRQDDEGNILGELKNTWSGDRLSSIFVKAGDEERLTEYTYNTAGDRIAEQNYRNGNLERAVRTEGEREVEELYMNGAVILRAIWEGGRKISEERVRPER